MMDPVPATLSGALRRLLALFPAFSLALCLSAGARAEETSSSLQPRVRIETTAGPFVIELDAVRAPLTAENFLRYVRDGFYQGLLMHRVIANFVVQGGGYTPDYQPRPTSAAIVNESGNGLSNTRGSVGMARGDTPHSATSQFYVNVNDNPGLNPLPSRWGYTVFGRVVEGMDVIDAMAYVATGERSGFADTPLQQILIQRAYVLGEEDVAPPAGAPAPGALATEPPDGDPPAAGQEVAAGQPEGTEALPAEEAADAGAAAPAAGGMRESPP